MAEVAEKFSGKSNQVPGVSTSKKNSPAAVNTNAKQQLRKILPAQNRGSPVAKRKRVDDVSNR